MTVYPRSVRRYPHGVRSKLLLDTAPHLLSAGAELGPISGILNEARSIRKLGTFGSSAVYRHEVVKRVHNSVIRVHNSVIRVHNSVKRTLNSVKRTLNSVKRTLKLS